MICCSQMLSSVWVRWQTNSPYWSCCLSEPRKNDIWRSQNQNTTGLICPLAPQMSQGSLRSKGEGQHARSVSLNKHNMTRSPFLKQVRVRRSTKQDRQKTSPLREERAFLHSFSSRAQFICSKASRESCSNNLPCHCRAGLNDGY